MVAGMLGQLGIHAQVSGEHLQSAVGELPMAGLVRVLVADEEAERARAVIADWERAQPPAEVPEVAVAARSTRSSWAYALAGLLAGVALAWLLLAREEARAVDYDGDGKADEELFYVQDVLVRIEQDRNGDGRPDEIARFDRRGHIKQVDSDNDFNGVFESVTHFERGQAVLWTNDHDQDGRIDGRGSLPTPAIEYVEVFDLATGTMARRYRWCLGRLQSEQVDTDKDGHLDTLNLYDQRGDIAVRTRDLAAAMLFDCPRKTR